MSDTQTVVGTCQGITEKPSGWTEFKIMVEGNQYPLHLATKLEKLIQAGRDTRGEPATWTYKEVESENINPNSGRRYTNRYLEKVEAGGVSAIFHQDGNENVTTITSPGVPEPNVPVYAPLAPGDKDRAISRMTCLKAAAALYQARGIAGAEDGSSDDIPLAVMKAARRFEHFIYGDIVPLPFNGGGSEKSPSYANDPDFRDEDWAPALSEHDQQIPFGD